MHLVYVYINKDRNRVIKRQAFTLRSEWNIHYDEDTPQITIERNTDYYNIFSEQDSPVNSLSVIVGTNGAGKTSFLKSLMNLSLTVPYEDREEDEEKKKLYLDFRNEQREKDIGIKVFEDDGYLRVYQNINASIKVVIDGKKIKKDICDITEKRHSYTYIQNSYFFRLDRSGQKAIEKTTNVYISNSNHHDDDFGFSSDAGIVNSIYLTQKTIDMLNSSFFKRNSLIGDIQTKSTQFTLFQDQLSKKISDNVLNQILILRYLETVKDGNEFYEGYQLDNYTIGTYSLGNVVRNILENENNKDTYIEVENLLKKLNIKMENDRCDLIENMKLNLCLEYIFIYPKQIDIGFEPIHNSISVEKMYSKVCEAVKKTDHEGYYDNAINEITQLSNVVETFTYKKYTSNKLPPVDGAYSNLLTLLFNSDESRQLINFIDQRMNSDFSFVLKYLRFNFGMSSGELASLNIFAWMYSLPILNKLDSRIIESTNEEILLLIDEAELYAHPDWQRQFISALISNTKYTLKNKNVQFVIATHSPLVLSDVPNDDVLYMDKCNNVTSFYEDKESFGSNIYDLYRDGFFLSTTIGKYSANKIDEVINYVVNKDKSKLSENEAIYIIRNIGEPVLKKIIISKWKEVFGWVIGND